MKAFLRTMIFDAHADRSPRLDPKTGTPDLNRSFGPFLADLIEPHHVALHDRLDFDINNLFVVAGFTHELGALLLLVVLLHTCCRLPLLRRFRYSPPLSAPPWRTCRHESPHSRVFVG